ncbi:alpha/beta-hydrolase [Cryphonectria parasitica EP155]|uniref:Alpha/beta-hydrolase n=1 Tax=Cryphonectria parasitica (strain ATCC 38755 / EP155) TaxID=660469 RepID=A0A9P4YD46_CRYP1|nr:alpha/beta-hydrolase [Cryphonectria parasitica EP155]KAF3771181.1 alpha/beta-hydrolase [Cryphonectria parasitica EP155]
MRTSYLPLAACLAGVGWAASPLYETVINITDFGVVQGRAALNSSQGGHVPNWEDISFFGGVPYGADTSGANRWLESQRATAWTGTKNTTDFGPLCPFAGNPQDMVARYGESEDCLTLNIWTPATSADDLLPVVFWTVDDGTVPPQSVYEGSGLASQGVIFVTYNYRSGVLGWLADPALVESFGNVAATNNATGNWGLEDQLHAFKWVSANIALFGGDPDHITVAGQGSGAATVLHLLNNEEVVEFDLNIHNAIAQSGLRYPSDPELQHESGAGAYFNQTYAKELAVGVLDGLNVSTVAEARALSYEQLVEATANVSFRPNLDYYLIPETYALDLQNGSATKVPVLTGHVADVETSAVVTTTTTTTTTGYQTLLQSRYGSSWDSSFLALYPSANDTQTLVRDQARVSSWAFAADYTDSSGGLPTYTYYWDYASPLSNGRASHGSEIPYALNNLWAQAGANLTTQDYTVASLLSAYWVNFIKTSDPSNSTLATNETALPATWNANSPTDNTTFRVGSAWEEIPIAGSVDKIALFEEFFAAQTPS